MERLLDESIGCFIDKEKDRKFSQSIGCTNADKYRRSIAFRGLADGLGVSIAAQGS